jgi:hypothetical protein
MALVVVASSSGVASAETEEFDALSAIQDVVPGVMLDGEIIDATVDQAVDTSGLEVTVPSDPQDGVSVEPESGGSFTIGLPFAADAELTDGDQGVVYDNGNGSSTVPLVKEDGVIQIITTIADESAPVAYVYPLDLPEGGRLELLDDGGALVLDSFGEVVATIDAPWAKDADGKSVPTYYAVVGDSLVQVVAHGPGDAYPIVADPRVSLGWWAYIHFNRAETKTIANGGWAATGGAASCAAAGLAIGGPAGAAAMGASCLVYLGWTVYVAGVAENSNPRRCLVIKWRPGGQIVPETYRDSRCV